MRKGILVASVFLALAGWAMAHTGGLDPNTGEPYWEELGFNSLDPQSYTENEGANNPSGAYKGWWFVTLTNNSGTAWSKVTITPGVGDLVAIVQGNGLVDENGFVGNSIVTNQAGNFSYDIVRGTGSRTYDNGATGSLWGKAEFTFTTPLASGPTQKVGFRIYTDNSWYTGPYAPSYQMTIAPVAVPEPATLIVLGGLSLLGLRRRRSR